ncbi:MAG: hypothetical protein IJX06_05365 [Clostridia bacterium]|nr:hypothetical protein [Clostridia bacterium]MBQ7224961.1 hypothetical protein [Clostridia bacterium]
MRKIWRNTNKKSRCALGFFATLKNDRGLALVTTGYVGRNFDKKAMKTGIFSVKSVLIYA